jgi:uncharacterized protein YcnI
MHSHPSRAVVAALAFVLSGILAVDAAEAHVSISSGPATANKSQKVTFSVGCEGFDTMRVRVEIPASVTSVRALRSDFGKPVLTRDDADVVTEVTWQKPDAEILDDDSGYYELTIRVRVGDVPFSRILFTVHQTCLDADGLETTVSWDQPPGGEGNPAPALVVVPARQSGWNRYVLVATMAEADVPTYLGDAQIVWRGSAAYSSNPNTASLISSTPDVTALTGDLVVGDELWVKY